MGSGNRRHGFLAFAVASAVLALSPGLVRSAWGDEPVNRLSRGKSEPPSSLAVISYNVQFLPGPISFFNDRKEPTYRAETMGRLLKDYDIVGLQEVFDRHARRLLLGQLQEAWGKEYQVLISPTPPDGRLMGGLAIASHLRFLVTHSMIYSQASTIEKYGLRADGFAAKGALHARIWRGGGVPKSQFVDVFVTHLESKDDKVRAVQYRELADFVRKHSDPQHPTLILGDMNTCGDLADRQDANSGYGLMMSLYRSSREPAPLIDVWPKLHPTERGGTKRQQSKDGGRRIDYVLLSNPAKSACRLAPCEVRVNRFLDPRVTALSDHSAVEAMFNWVDSRDGQEKR